MLSISSPCQERGFLGLSRASTLICNREMTIFKSSCVFPEHPSAASERSVHRLCIENSNPRWHLVLPLEFPLHRSHVQLLGSRSWALTSSKTPFLCTQQSPPLWSKRVQPSKRCREFSLKDWGIYWNDLSTARTGKGRGERTYILKAVLYAFIKIQWRRPEICMLEIIHFILRKEFSFLHKAKRQIEESRNRAAIITNVYRHN